MGRLLINSYRFSLIRPYAPKVSGLIHFLVCEGAFFKEFGSDYFSCEVRWAWVV